MTDSSPQDLRFVVVGGSSGMGLGISRYLLDAGARVTIVSRSEDNVRQAAKELGEPDELTTATADVRDENEVRALFEGLGRFDHLVVTAAQGYSLQPIAGMDLESVRPFIESKIVGALLLAKYAPPQMNPGGSITFTGGIAADRPAPGGAVVALVNASFLGLTNALSLELAPIRVNTLAPGWVDTPIWDKIAGPRKQGMLDAMAEKLPSRKLTEAADVGHTVLFAATSKLMTGSVITIDGGQRLV